MSFDTLAPFYRGMETVLAGNLMQCSRTAFLAEAKHCRNALLLGEGPGKFLVELLRVNPAIRVTCVEQSSRMIAVATRQLQRQGLDSSRVHFVPCDARQWHPASGPFDLVVTNFFLDCFTPEQLEPLITNIAREATGRARWLLADFQVPARGWRRWRAKAIVALMYVFFRAATGLPAARLANPDEYLRSAGFELASRREINFGLIHADMWQRIAV